MEDRGKGGGRGTENTFGADGGQVKGEGWGVWGQKAVLLVLM